MHFSTHLRHEKYLSRGQMSVPLRGCTGGLHLGTVVDVQPKKLEQWRQAQVTDRSGVVG